MKIINRITFASLVLLNLIACGFSSCSYYSDLEVIEQVIEEDDLIGTYQLDIESSASVGPGELILKNKSDIILKNIPVELLDIFIDYPQDINELKDINGKWQLATNSGDPTISVELKFQEVDDDLNNLMTDWKLYQKDDKPLILIILGDPDSCEALRFIKKSLKKNTYNI